MANNNNDDSKNIIWIPMRSDGRNYEDFYPRTLQINISDEQLDILA